MPISISATGFDVEGSRVTNGNALIDKNANQCPTCHIVIQPDNFSQAWFSHDWLEVFFRCTNESCQRSFIGLYEFIRHINGQALYNLDKVLPVSPLTPEFAPEIVSISPTFALVFGQASSAEDHQLDDIAGPGYRKALEFLIKDYAISLHPNKEEEIKRLELMKVIKQFLSGDSLPLVSSRAAWLGNDETHYERRWVGKDLTDLKKLIAATVHFITMQRLVADLPSDMPDPKTKREASALEATVAI
jgi:hypothetical protein